MTQPPGNGHDRVIEIERPGPGDHRLTLVIDGRPVETLADLPPLRNHLLFVGLEPSPVSVAAGHHQQDEAGHAFWRRLVEAGILPSGTALDSADDALVAAGHGITDLHKRPAGPAATSDEELTPGVGLLWQRVAVWRPGAVVFIDRRAAAIVARRPVTEPWGQLQGVALSGRPCFLLPAPSAPPAEVAAGLNYLRNLAAALPD